MRILLLLLALLPMMANAWDAEIDGIYYNLNESNGEAMVTYAEDWEHNDLVHGDWVDWNSNKLYYIGDITIPSSITAYGEIYNVTSIEYHAFVGCTDLTSVTIPGSVTSISGEAFYNCSGLTSVHISDLAAWCNISFNDGNPLYYAHHLYLNETEITDLVIPNSVTSISNSAFSGCSGLTSVTIGNSETSIGDYAFNSCSGLTSVTIGNSVTSIGDNAFNSCSGLTSVHISDLAAWCNISFNNGFSNPLNCAHHLYLNETEITDLVIPNSVTSIGDNAFNSCSGLTSVTIPGSVTSISNSAFSGCSGLTSVTIGNSVTSIGDNAFYRCSGLTSITIPGSVTSIGKSAFSGCSGLTSVTIGNRVTTIGICAFFNCSGLTEMICLSENVPQTGANVFAYVPLSNATLYVRKKLLSTYHSSSPWRDFGTISPIEVNMNGFYYAFDKSKEEATIAGPVGSVSGALNIPSYVVYEGVDFDVVAIDDRAFENCVELTSVTIPNSITSIGNEAFSGCTGLTAVSISKKVKSIGQSPFKGCIGLTSIVVDSGNTVYDSRNNCNAIIETATGKLIQGCNTTVIPDDVTSIGNYAFYNCSGLTSVTIPSSVTVIGESAFLGCSGLASVTLNNKAIVSANRTENDNFKNIFGNQVKEYIIGDDVTAIGSNAFNGCSSMTSVTIGNKVTSIRNNAFNNCSGLTSVKISDLATWCKMTFGNAQANPLSYAHHLYLNGRELKNLEIPNNVTAIKDYAFYGCSGLTSVTIPGSVTAIGSDAFYDCNGVTSVTINSDAIVSANRTLNNNFKNIFGSQVKEYMIGDEVTAIGSNAFYGCNSMTSITIGNKVTSIGEFAFQNCSGLTSVKISDLAAWCKMSFGNAHANPLSIAHHLYLNGQEVKDLEIPNSVTAIKDYAFYGCSGLTSVTIPGSVTSIGSDAFDSCNGVTSVTINSDAIVSANKTENDNFKNIFGSQVKEYVIGDEVTAIGEYAFYNCSSMTSVTIGECVTSIGQYAFNGCKFASVVIPNSVTSIGESAFRDNLNLTTVSVGENIKSIGDNAFYGCNNMMTFTCYAVDIPTANSSVFEGIDLTGATLYVPASALEDYEEVKPWRRFGTILPIDENSVPTAIDTIGVEAGDNEKQFYDLSGRRVTSSPRGLRIVRDASGNTRKVLVK